MKQKRIVSGVAILSVVVMLSACGASNGSGGDKSKSSNSASSTPSTEEPSRKPYDFSGSGNSNEVTETKKFQLSGDYSVTWVIEGNEIGSDGEGGSFDVYLENDDLGVSERISPRTGVAEGKEIVEIEDLDSSKEYYLRVFARDGAKWEVNIEPVDL